MNDKDQRIIELAPTTGYLQTQSRKNNPLNNTPVSEIERKIDMCIEDYTQDEGTPDYAIVTREFYGYLDRHDLIQEFKHNPFFGEIVAYFKDASIKVIVPEDIDDETSRERYDELVRGKNPIVFARSKWCKRYARMTFYNLECSTGDLSQAH
ncbi:hypothetical protein COU57_05140 [Candidatus Pacearchaeota archaeon CG10_big_fil_rev_8_21_14_0_10_32_14]|nr:MAG: hypothetical protein COU57_05140 [Candidatus Pacearchaeota archaeon CG10_big_fil_rev_8_21_14_0_10_32_14]